MISLERVHEITKLPQERAEIIEPRPPPTWPDRGDVEVENLAVRYGVSCILFYYDIQVFTRWYPAWAAKCSSRPHFFHQRKLL